jgi:hypothetical protein
MHFRRRGAVISALLACLACLAVPSAALAFEPGDGLPPSMDNAPQSSRAACANHSSPAGSLTTRALSAGPQLHDRSLAFISGLCIYLPPRYSDSRLRYPVIYLLHGGAGAQSDWVTQGHIQQLMDQAYAKNPRSAAIVVMPDASPMAAWFDTYDGTSVDAQDPLGQRLLNETYVLRWVIPFVDRHFRTIADRAGRSIDGLSNGGFGSMMLAAKAPGLFAAAGSMDGNLAWLSFGGSSEQYLDTPEAGNPSSYAPGPRMVSLGYREGQLPVNLAENLDHVPLILDMGATPYCTAAELASNGCEPAAFEQLFVPANRDFVTELGTVHHVGALDYRETVGAHEWQFWTQWFAERQLPFLETHMDPPSPDTLPMPSTPVPSAFRYRSVAPDFTVWGYHVSVKRSVTEFLDLDQVAKETILIHGSGQVSILTAPRYVRGRSYRIEGAAGAPQTAIANKLGQLRFGIDLGPSDQLDGQSASPHDIAETQPETVQTEQLSLFSSTPLAGVTRLISITIARRSTTPRRRDRGRRESCGRSVCR